ncbi:hypothetical protein [Actinokineospora iranica]|uniref:Uncharacterized protein n=1 Tax=Actinokineospora iranica TaxID=1271860 RepID=A0A1G6U376_9PSEU|nr:hypothetical protein [Actinokineospora iranica]SDD35741.1 hypothetical protein SAMN05216174_11082 [Actinokineospora iranica]
MAGETWSDWETPRPDLAVPLAARPTVLSRAMAAPREPDFTMARHQTLVIALSSGALMLAAQTLVVDSARAPVIAAAVVLVLYALAREVYLLALERRQRAFEPDWLARRSETLRDSEFEVVRCVVGDRVYDLSDGEQAARLLASADADTRVEIDFTYPPAAIERASSRFGDIRFRPIRAEAPPRARFPDARYGLQASGRKTFWRLGASVVVTIAAPAGRAATRAGTGRSARPGAARPVGGRPAEMP